MVRRSWLMVLTGADPCRRRRLGHRASAHRLHSQRGPGLHDGRACSCPTAPRWSAPAPRSRRSPRSPWRRPAWRRWSPSPACRSSTTAPRWPTPASPTSSSRTGASRQGEGPGPALDRRPYQRRRWTACRTAGPSSLVPPPIQGIGNSGGFQMQVEQRDGSFDLAKLQARPTQAIVEQARDPELDHQCRSARSAPACRRSRIDVDRSKAETLKVDGGRRLLDAVRLSRLDLRQPASTSSASPSRSTSRPNSKYRAASRGHPQAQRAGAPTGKMVPIGAWPTLKPAVGAADHQPLQPLSRRRRSSARRRRASARARRWT